MEQSTERLPDMLAAQVILAVGAIEATLPYAAVEEAFSALLAGDDALQARVRHVKELLHRALFAAYDDLTLYPSEEREAG